MFPLYLFNQKIWYGFKKEKINNLILEVKSLIYLDRYLFTVFIFLFITSFIYLFFDLLIGYWCRHWTLTFCLVFLIFLSLILYALCAIALVTFRLRDLHNLMGEKCENKWLSSGKQSLFLWMKCFYEATGDSFVYCLHTFPNLSWETSFSRFEIVSPKLFLAWTASVVPRGWSLRYISSRDSLIRNFFIVSVNEN